MKKSILRTRRALVLNKLWTAVGVATMQRAITLLYSQYEDGKPKAHVITPPPIGEYETYTWEDWSRIRPEEGEDILIAPRQVFKVPEVILLTRYEHTPDRTVNFCRRQVWKRDNYRCQYCGEKPPLDELTLDHIIPTSLGGHTDWLNCVLACYKCNSQKADRVPVGFEEYGPVAVRAKGQKDFDSDRNPEGWKGRSPMKLLRNPYKPRFSLFKSDKVVIPETWKHWVDKMYWEVPLGDVATNDFRDV